jgi:biopolymer transport protein ExbD
MAGPVRSAPVTERDENILPLVNVIFLLLLWLLFAGHLERAAEGGVEPPRARASAAPHAAPRLVLGRDGTLTLDGGDVTRANLTARLAGTAATEGTLVVLADGAGDTVAVVELLDLVRVAGVREVELVTRGAARGRP